MFSFNYVTAELTKLIWSGSAEAATIAVLEKNMF